MIQRTVLEWQTIVYGDGDDQIPVAAADRIAAVAAASPLAGQGGGGVVEHGRKGLRARGIVGLVAAEGCALEILPKIDIPGATGAQASGSIRQRLIHMLAVAMSLKIDPGQMTALDWQRHTLLEILIRLFSEKLIDALRQGLPRQYAHEDDDLAVLRGRLDVTRQFTTLLVTPTKLACRYDVLSADIALNQVMKAVVTKLAQVARSTDNQRRLRQLDFAYAEITDVPVSELRWDRVVLDRTNARWRELHDLAHLFLGDRFQTTTAGGGHGFSLLFEMNNLFEAYVARSLTRALAGGDLRVVSQGGRLYCLESHDRQGLFQTRPDILIKRGNTVVQVIDTKWKRISASIDDPKRGVAQGDVYQMMAYGRLYDCGRLTLLYPHHNDLGTVAGLQATHRITASADQLETATVDVATALGLPDRLRELSHA